jgi:hypothetical protein
MGRTRETAPNRGTTMDGSWTRRDALLMAGSVLMRFSGTAAVAAAQTGVVTEAVVSEQFADAPPAPAFVALTRTILPPGTSITSGESPGPRLILVVSGDVDVQRAEGSSGFLRAADASPAMTSTGGGMVERVLQAADTYRFTSTEAVEFANTSPQAATYFDLIVFPQAPSGLAPYTTTDGVVVDPLVTGQANRLPSTPLEIRIDRLELALGSQIDLLATDGPRLLVVQSGTLGISVASGVITYSSAAGLNPGSTAGRSRAALSDRETLLRARGSVVVQADARGSIRNLGRNHLELLSVQLRSVASAGQP